MKKRNLFKKLLSMLLAVLIVLSGVIPCMSAFADDGVIGFNDIEIFYEDGSLVPDKQEDGETEYIEYMMEGEKKQFIYKFIDCTLPDNGYVKWTSDTPTVCDVTPEGIVRAFDSSKGAAVRLWLDNEVGTIPLVGGIMKKALEKVLFNDTINVDTMDTDAIIALVEEAFGSDSILAKYVDSYKGQLIDSLRSYLDKVNTVISCTMYNSKGEVLDTDSFSVCVTKSEELYADFIPNGTHITNKQDLPTTVAKGSSLQLSACTTPTRLHMGVVYSVKSTSIFTDGKVVATVDDSGLVKFRNTGKVTILVSPDTEGFINNLLKYINYIYQLENTGVINSDKIADILINYVGLDINKAVLTAILDAAFVISDIVGDTADPVQLSATAIKVIANIILQFTTNDSITFTVVDGVPCTDFEISGASSVKEGAQIQLAIENAKPVAADISDITWSSSDPSIASVDPVTGVITGRDAGGSTGSYSQQSVEITATSAANNISKTVTLTVTGKTGKYLSDVEITMDNPSINIGGDEYAHAAVYPARVAESKNLYLKWGIETQNPETGETEYLWAQAPYQETDEEGNLLFDEEGNPVVNDGTVTDGIGKIDHLGHYYAVAGGTCVIACIAQTGYYIGDGNFFEISSVSATKAVDNGQPIESISISAVKTTSGGTLTTEDFTDENGAVHHYATVKKTVADGLAGNGCVVQASILPEDATNKKLKWFIDNEDYKLDKQDDASGTIEVKMKAAVEKTGSVNVYCVSEDGEVKSDILTITVTRNYATGNKTDQAEYSVINGQTVNVSHSMDFSGSWTGDAYACKNANWYSSDNEICSVVSVDSNGNAVLKGNDVGVVNITCVSADGTIPATATVTVYPDKSRLAEIIGLCEKTVINKTKENASDYKIYMRTLNYAYYIYEEQELASQTTVDTYADELLYIFYKLGGFVGLTGVSILDASGEKAKDYISVKVDSVNYKNSSYKLGFALNPKNGMYSSVEWESSNSSVSVDKNGLCRPSSNSACDAVITCTARDYMGAAVTDSIHIAFAKTPATSVSIAPANIVGGKAGETLQLEANIAPLGITGKTNADVKGVIWESSDKSVATVDQNGLVTFVYGGDCTIFVTTVDGGHRGSCAVNVITNYDSLQELVNTYTSLSLSIENYYPDSYNYYKATIEEAQALIDAAASTQNEVNAMYQKLQDAYNGLKKYTYIQRIELYLDGEPTSDYYQYNLSLLKEGISYTNAELNLKTRLYPNNASYSTVEWISENSEEITIDQSGKARPAKNKSCYGRIICRVTDHFGSTWSDDVWVSFAYTPVTGISLAKSEYSGKIGDQEQMVVTISPTGTDLAHIGAATIKDVFWQSDNESVATVDQNGLVTLTGAGATTIRVTTYDGGFTAECTVSTEGNRNALLAALANSSSINYMDYKYEYGIAFRDAYNAAEAALSNNSLTQSEIDAAAEALNSAAANLAGNEFVKAEYISVSYDNQYHNLGVSWKSQGTGVIDNNAVAYSYKGKSTTYNSRVILNAALPEAAASNYTSVSWSVADKSGDTDVDINGNSLTILASSARKSAMATLVVTAVDVYGRTVTRTIRAVVSSELVTGISIDQTEVSRCAADGPFKLNASVSPSGAKVTDVLWSSSNESVATVDSNGNVTPKNTGFCVITAESFDGGYTASCSITFTTDYRQLAALYSRYNDFYNENKDTHKYTNASMKALEEALIQANKLVTESTADQADVDLMIAKLNSAYEGLVEFVPLSGISISLTETDKATIISEGYARYSSASINGAEMALNVQIPQEFSGAYSIVWSSSNDAVSVSESGVVTNSDATAHYAVITAAVTDEGGNTAEASINVSFVRVAAVSVSFDSEYVFGAPATTKTIKPKVASNSALTTPSITACSYESANPEIAQVDENGVITFVSYGETVITAICADGGMKASIKAYTTCDTTALAAAVNEYSAVNYTDYAYSYGTAFNEAYKSSAALLDDYTVTQEAVDASLFELQTKYNEMLEHPFIFPGEVALASGGETIENGTALVKDENSQAVITAVYNKDAMLKSAVFEYSSAVGVSAEVVNGDLVLTKTTAEPVGSIVVTFRTVDDYDREVVVTKSVKIVDAKTQISSFKFTYNGSEVEEVTYKATVISNKTVQLGINTYPDGADGYKSAKWTSSNSQITVDENGLVKMGTGSITTKTYQATIKCVLTLNDGSTIENSIVVTFTR